MKRKRKQRLSFQTCLKLLLGHEYTKFKKIENMYRKCSENNLMSKSPDCKRIVREYNNYRRLYFGKCKKIVALSNSVKTKEELIRKSRPIFRENYELYNRFVRNVRLYLNSDFKIKKKRGRKRKRGRKKTRK